MIILFVRRCSESLYPSQIFISKKWGFTKYDRDDFERLKEERRFLPDGVGVQFLPDHGTLARWEKIQATQKYLS